MGKVWVLMEDIRTLPNLPKACHHSYAIGFYFKFQSLLNRKSIGLSKVFSVQTVRSKMTNYGLITILESDFFFYQLTEPIRNPALECLNTNIGKCRIGKPLYNSRGERNVVLGTEIAVWQDLFADCSTIIAHFREAENETWSTMPGSVCQTLFHLRMEFGTNRNPSGKASSYFARNI